MAAAKAQCRSGHGADPTTSTGTKADAVGSGGAPIATSASSRKPVKNATASAMPSNSRVSVLGSSLRTAIANTTIA